MSAPTAETEVTRQLAPAEWAAPASSPLASAATAPSALERIQSLGGRAIAETTYQLRRLGATTLAGIAAMAAAATVFVASNLPQGAAVTSLQSELAQRPAAAGGTALAGAAGGALLAALPPRSEAPEVVAKIYEEAQAAGVELPRGQYEYLPARDGAAARYRMTFPVHASYPQIRSFLDRTLIALPAVAVEGLRIERKNVGDGSVDAEVKLAAYVGSEP